MTGTDGRTTGGRKRRERAAEQEPRWRAEGWARTTAALRWSTAGAVTALLAVVVPWTSATAATVEVARPSSGIVAALVVPALGLLVVLARRVARRAETWGLVPWIAFACAVVWVLSVRAAMVGERPLADLDVGAWLAGGAVVQVLVGAAACLGTAPTWRGHH